MRLAGVKIVAANLFPAVQDDLGRAPDLGASPACTRLATSLRAVRQSSRPSVASNTARNCSLKTSHCTMTLP